MERRSITLAGGSSVTFEQEDGVIHLEVFPTNGHAVAVQIGREHRDAIEAAWGEARAEQDAYRTERATRAVEWLRLAGLGDAKALADAGLLDIDAVLARAEAHEAGLVGSFWAAASPTTTQPSQFT